MCFVALQSFYSAHLYNNYSKHSCIFLFLDNFLKKKKAM